jgi:hypothetical protein
MQRASWSCAVVLVLLCVGVLAASCRRAEPEPSEPALVWRKLGAWSGHGSMQTEPFISDTGSLRVRWQTREQNPAGSGRFRVVVHSDVSGRSLGIAVDAHGAGGDTVYFSEDPRPFFLAVESEHIDWTLAVEEPLVATVSPSPTR